MTSLFASDLDPTFRMRPEFGELARQSGRTLNQVSHAQIVGAENLLAKAVAAGAGGDPDRAEQLVQRAAAMPYDPREEGSPGVHAATLLVYRLVSDRFEESEYGDIRWLDVALDVHARLVGPGKAHLASVVHGFVLQDGLFDVSPDERRRIRQAVGDAPLEADLGDGPDASVERRRAIIRSLVAAASALNEAYGA